MPVTVSIQTLRDRPLNSGRCRPQAAPRCLRSPPTGCVFRGSPFALRRVPATREQPWPHLISTTQPSDIAAHIYTQSIVRDHLARQPRRPCGLPLVASALLCDAGKHGQHAAFPHALLVSVLFRSAILSTAVPAVGVVAGAAALFASASLPHLLSHCQQPLPHPHPLALRAAEPRQRSRVLGADNGHRCRRLLPFLPFPFVSATAFPIHSPHLCLLLVHPLVISVRPSSPLLIQGGLCSASFASKLLLATCVVDAAVHSHRHRKPADCKQPRQQAQCPLRHHRHHSQRPQQLIHDRCRHPCHHRYRCHSHCHCHATPSSSTSWTGMCPFRAWQRQEAAQASW
jgi:hypothetical protein